MKWRHGSIAPFLNFLDEYKITTNWTVRILKDLSNSRTTPSLMNNNNSRTFTPAYVYRGLVLKGKSRNIDHVLQ